MAQRKARGAHNSEDIGSKPIAGIHQHIAPVLQALEQHKNRFSSAAEREAHNFEVVRIKTIRR